MSNATYFPISAAPGLGNVTHQFPHEKLNCQPELFEASLDQSGDMTPFWMEREYRPGAPQRARRDAVRPRPARLQRARPDDPRLVRPHPRVDPAQGHVRGVGARRARRRHRSRRTGSARDWLASATAWYDRYLKGLSTPASSSGPTCRCRTRPAAGAARASSRSAAARSASSRSPATAASAPRPRRAAAPRSTRRTTGVDVHHRAGLRPAERHRPAGPRPLADVERGRRAHRRRARGPRPRRRAGRALRRHAGRDVRPALAAPPRPDRRRLVPPGGGASRAGRHADPRPDPLPADRPRRPRRRQPAPAPDRARRAAPHGGRVRRRVGPDDPARLRAHERAAVPRGDARRAAARRARGRRDEPARRRAARHAGPGRRRPGRGARLRARRDRARRGARRPVGRRAARRAGRRHGADAAGRWRCEHGRPGDHATTTTRQSCAKPTSRFTGPRPRIRRTGIRLRGRANGRGCAIRRVRVSIARKAGRKCRFLRADGTFSRARSCRRTSYLTARGTTRWTFERRLRLPRGKYLMWSRVETTSAIERKARDRNMARARR